MGINVLDEIARWRQNAADLRKTADGLEARATKAEEMMQELFPDVELKNEMISDAVTVTGAVKGALCAKPARRGRWPYGRLKKNGGHMKIGDVLQAYFEDMRCEANWKEIARYTKLTRNQVRCTLSADKRFISDGAGNWRLESFCEE